MAAVVIVAMAVAVAGGLFAGAQLAGGPRTVPGDGSIDAGFARDMQSHHRQAVQMSTFVLDGSDDPDRQASNPAVQQLAQTVVNPQTAELTVMREMLAARGGPPDGP